MSTLGSHEASLNTGNYQNFIQKFIPEFYSETIGFLGRRVESAETSKSGDQPVEVSKYFTRGTDEMIVIKITDKTIIVNWGNDACDMSIYGNRAHGNISTVYF